MDGPAHQSRFAFWSVSIAGIGTFLTFPGSLYRLEEILTLWLFFALGFALIILAVAIGVVIYSASLGVLRLMSGAARAILHVRLATPTLHTK